MINNYKYYNLPAFKHLKYLSFGSGGEDPKWEYFHIKNEYAGDNKLTINLSTTLFTSANTEYSFDKETWEALDFGSTTYLTMTEGATVYLRGTDWVRKQSGAANPIFTCTENFNVGGCILSLLDYTDMKNITEIPENFAHYMFYRVKKLIKADFNVGNATTVGADGFNSCFISCSNLTTTPNFSNITSGVGSQGFAYCFTHCQNINYVYAPSVSNWNTSYFYLWLDDVSETGTMSCPSGLSIPTGVSGIPSGWTRVDR